MIPTLVLICIVLAVILATEVAREVMGGNEL